MSQAETRAGDRSLVDRGWVDKSPTDNAETALRLCRALAQQIESGLAVERERVSHPQLSASTPSAGDSGQFVAVGVGLQAK